MAVVTLLQTPSLYSVDELIFIVGVIIATVGLIIAVIGIYVVGRVEAHKKEIRYGKGQHNKSASTGRP